MCGTNRHLHYFTLDKYTQLQTKCGNALTDQKAKQTLTLTLTCRASKLVQCLSHTQQTTVDQQLQSMFAIVN